MFLRGVASHSLNDPSPGIQFHHVGYYISRLDSAPYVLACDNGRAVGTFSTDYPLIRPAAFVQASNLTHFDISNL
jgi:hypothetical protein